MNDDDNSQFLRTVPFYLKLRVPKSLFDGGNSKKYQITFYIMSDSLLGVGMSPFFNLDYTLRYTDS